MEIYSVETLIAALKDAYPNLRFSFNPCSAEYGDELEEGYFLSYSNDYRVDRVWFPEEWEIDNETFDNIVEDIEYTLTHRYMDDKMINLN